jgi:DNA-binding MarR family transcriptional regulator
MPTPPPTTKSLSPLTAHIGYWLRLVSNHVSHQFRLKVEGHGVTVAEWVVLRELLDLGQVNPSQIADALGMTRGAISKLVERLVVKKLIHRSSSNADRRFQSISLTAAGRKLVPVLARLADRNDNEFFSHLSPEERKHLTESLQEIVRRHHLQVVPID